MKKFKYAVPLLLVSTFPFYFKSVSQSYSWLTADSVGQAFLGVMTIAIIGAFGAFAVAELV